MWLVAFGAVRAGEPGKHRPAAVVSSELVLAGVQDEPVVVVPISSFAPASPLRPAIRAGEGVERPSRAICGAVRGVARSRLLRRLGSLGPETLSEVEQALALMLALAPRGK